MTRNRILILIILVVVIVTFAFFYFSPEDNEEEIRNDDTNEFSQQEVPNNPNQITGGTTNDFVLITYGGKEDIKTLEENGREYALLRNPPIVEGLVLAATDLYGDYYFAEDNNGERFVFTEGSPRGKHGYNDIGLVSKRLIRERNSATEYFAAYPKSLDGQAVGLVPVTDTGSSNTFLKSRRILITNLSSNISVVSEIDHRGGEQGSLLVSDLTRKSLGIDNGSTGHLRVELVPAENFNLGIVR